MPPRQTRAVRYWTVEEARTYLPRLRQLVALVQQAAVPGREPGTMHIAAGSEHAEAALAELQEGDIILRHLGAGLVDFPSLDGDGELRLLCWRTDEAELGWWHRPQDGFAGRRPIEPRP